MKKLCDIKLSNNVSKFSKEIGEYGQTIAQSHTIDQPMAVRGKDTEN